MTARLKTDKGTQLIEMAMLSPFLVALALGATDFARAAYWSITVANAARTGAQYAIQSESHSNKTALIQAAGQNDATDISGSVTVTTSRTCNCPGLTATTTCTPTPICSGGVSKEMYVTVTATRAFTTLVDYPGLPHTVNLIRTAILRVQ